MSWLSSELPLLSPTRAPENPHGPDCDQGGWPGRRHRREGWSTWWELKAGSGVRSGLPSSGQVDRRPLAEMNVMAEAMSGSPDF